MLLSLGTVGAELKKADPTRQGLKRGRFAAKRRDEFDAMAYVLGRRMIHEGIQLKRLFDPPDSSHATQRRKEGKKEDVEQKTFCNFRGKLNQGESLTSK